MHVFQMFVVAVLGLSWAWTIRREAGAKAHGPVRSVGEVFAHYPTLRGEALLFAAANVFAIGIQGVLAQRLGEAGQSLSTILGWSEPALLLACILGFFIICVLGMHPLVSVILLTTLPSSDGARRARRASGRRARRARARGRAARARARRRRGGGS